MKKGGKIAIGVICAIVIIVAIALYLAWSNLDSLVAGAIEKYGSEATGTSVTVGRVQISLSNGTAELDSLTIGNPSGFKSDYALKFDKIEIGLDTSSLTSDTIVMNNGVVDGASVNAEFKGTGTTSNLSRILDNLKRYAGPSQPEQQPAGAQKKFVVKTFRFTNGKATAIIDAAKARRTINIPDVSVHDIGVKSGGVDAAELARQLLRPVIDKALDRAKAEAKQKAIEALKKKAGEALKKKLEHLHLPSHV